MRLIDADKLNDSIDALFRHIEKSSGAHKYEAEAALLTVKQMVKTAPTVGGWISVKDKLPKEDGTMRGYLVAVGDWVGIMAFYDGEFRDGLYGRKPDYPVHHWMPLPEPPEVDRDADGA